MSVEIPEYSRFSRFEVWGHPVWDNTLAALVPGAWLGRVLATRRFLLTSKTTSTTVCRYTDNIIKYTLSVQLTMTSSLTWLSALAMLLQGHATAAWLWMVSVLGKMNRVVYSQAHVGTVAPDYIEPSFLWLPSSSLALDTPFQCQLWIAILSHSAHVAKVSKSSLLNTTVDILAQLQSVEDVFVSDVDFKLVKFNSYFH